MWVLRGVVEGERTRAGSSRASRGGAITSTEHWIEMGFEVRMGLANIACRVRASHETNADRQHGRICGRYDRFRIGVRPLFFSEERPPGDGVLRIENGCAP